MMNDISWLDWAHRAIVTSRGCGTYGRIREAIKLAAQTK